MTLTPAPTAREDIEKAFDTVVASEETPVQTTTAEASALAPAEAAPAEAAPPKEGDRPRGPDGKFLKVDEKPAEAQPAAPAQPAKAKTPMPSSWKKELAPHWESLPPEVQANVIERERQYATGVSTYKTEADQAKAIRTAIAPFEPMLQRSNIPVDKWIQQMGIAHHLISAGTPQEKVMTLAQIIKNNGVDAQALVQVLSGQQPTFQQPAQAPTPVPQAPSITPDAVGQMVEQKLMERQVNDAYSAFMKDVDAGKHPHFEELKPTMAGLLQSGLAPDYPSAYEAALAMPQHRHLQQPAQQPQAVPVQPAVDKQAQAQRARSQAVSVKSSTPSTMAPSTGPKSLRDELSANFETRTASSRV